MSNKVEKPIVLFLAEGFGLSPRWQGNAILSAKPKNFERLWRSYYHLALLPFSRPEEKASFLVNPKTSYWPIMRGENYLPNRDFITSSLTDSPSGLKPVFEAAKTKNGALHLVLTLSADNSKSDLSHIMIILRQAAEYKIHRLYLHILLDGSFSNPSQCQQGLSRLEKTVRVSCVGEIVSLCGLRIASEQATAQYQRLLTDGEGSRYIDPAQAVDDYTGDLQDLSPAYFTQNPDAFVKDFDVVLFADHTLAPLGGLLTSLLERGWGTKRPKFLDLWVLQYLPFAYAERLNYVYIRPKPRSIAQVLGDHEVSTVLLAEASQGHELEYYSDASAFRKEIYLQPDRYKGYGEQWKSILDKVEETLCALVKGGRYDLVVGVSSVLPQVCGRSKFGECVKAVLRIDQLIGELEKTVLEQDGTLVIASPFGLAEAITQQAGAAGLTSTTNPVPLIIVANNAKVAEYKQYSPKNLIDELVFSRKDLRVLHQFLRLIAEQ